MAVGGAETETFVGQDLLLPIYEPDATARTPGASALVSAIQRCDALVIVSPGYHGSVSGMVKNALDYIEDLRDDPRPYLDGRAVGCVACAYGWQAAASTLNTLRTVTHALRGWPTPLGVAVNSALALDQEGTFPPDIDRQFRILAQQIHQFLATPAQQIA